LNSFASAVTAFAIKLKFYRDLMLHMFRADDELYNIYTS